jgi:hypothetical protein
MVSRLPDRVQEGMCILLDGGGGGGGGGGGWLEQLEREDREGTLPG